MTCLHHVQIVFSECSETFSLFRNIPECPGTFQICLGNISKILRNTFSYPETIRFVLETFKKSVPEHIDIFLKRCSQTIPTCLVDCFIFKMFQNIQICLETFQMIPEHSNPPKHSNVYCHANCSGTIWNVNMSNFFIYRFVLKKSDMFYKHVSVRKYSELFINMSRLFYFPKSSETFNFFRNIPECSGIF